MLLFEVGIYAKLCVSMIKTLWNIYIKQKTRNLTRIPIFAMIGGVIMCDFCKNIAMDNDEYEKNTLVETLFSKTKMDLVC